MNYSAKLERLVSRDSYLKGRERIFPSMGSLKWFIRLNHEALTQSGAISIGINRRILIDPMMFDEVVVHRLFASDGSGTTTNDEGAGEVGS